MENLSGQLKFKVTDLGPRLHKVTGQFFNWPKRVVLSYLSMQVVFCCFFQILFHSSLDKKYYWPTEGRLPNFYIGGKISNEAAGAVFLCDRKEREFLCEKVQSGHCFRQS